MQIEALCKWVAYACRRIPGSSPEKLLVVKLITMLILAAALQVSAKGVAQTITYSARETTLQKVFTAFKKQTGYLFFYRKEDLDAGKPVTVNLKNATLPVALKTVLSNQPLSFEIQGNTVFISRSAKESEVKQEKVSGIITNGEKQPLIGASVKIKGTTLGTTTDVNGKFSLDAQPGQVLVITYVGFASKEVIVSGNGLLAVQLEVSNSQVNEVVVVGYGTQTRKDLTGAISSVSGSATANTPATNITQMLQGQAAGVSVTSSSGAPGAGLTVSIRGLNSFGDNQPLYVVDGVPLGEGFNLSTLSTADIETIDILKDASAAAIYGTRASNGVVQITTKRGKSGQPVTSVNVYYGWQSLQKKVDVLDAKQFAAYAMELLGNQAAPLDSLANIYNTDWQDDVFQTAPIKSLHLNTRGGNERTQFAVSGGYLKQEGIIISSVLERLSFRASVTTKATSWLKLGTNVNFTRTTSNDINTDNIYTSPSITALQNQPVTQSGKISTGKWHGAAGGIYGDVFQPVAILNEEKNNNVRNMFFGNIFAEITLAKGWVFRSSLSENFSYNTYYYWYPHYEAGIHGNFGTGQKSESYNSYSNTIFDNTLTFSRSFKMHHLTLLAGTSAEAVSTRYFNGTTDGFMYNSVDDFTRGDLASNNRNLDGGTTQGRLASYFGRVNYTYGNRYLLTATLRRDGSYRFGPDNRWGLFPSASIGWVASEEDFMQSLKAVNNLKIRASYGLTGNQKIPSFLYMASIGGGVVASRQYGFGPTIRDGNFIPVSGRVTGKSFNGIPNTGIRWEATKQLDIGVDLTLWNRVTFTADYYSKLTDGLLLYKPLPITSGFTGSFVNLGEISNKGVELSLNTENLTGKLKWNSNFNISFNKNKVKSLADNLPVTSGFTRSEVGHSIGEFYGYMIDGIFQTDAEAAGYTYKDGTGATLRTYPNAMAGDIKWKDLNGDGMITAEKDRTFIGNPRPEFFYGFSNTFSYKGIELSVMLQGVQGNKIYNAMGIWLESMSGQGPYNQTARILNRWTPENRNTNVPRAALGDPNQNRQAGTTRWIEDASYLRVKNITLAYQLPATWLNKAGLSTVQVYCNLNNWFTITKYFGYDPEIGDLNGDTLSAGVDAGNYPGSKSIMAGININF